MHIRFKSRVGSNRKRWRRSWDTIRIFLTIIQQRHYICVCKRPASVMVDTIFEQLDHHQTLPPCRMAFAAPMIQHDFPLFFLDRRPQKQTSRYRKISASESCVFPSLLNFGALKFCHETSSSIYMSRWDLTDLSSPPKR